MTILDNATVHHYYKHRIAHYPKGEVSTLGWKSKNCQQKRFEALCQLADFSGSTIMDMGCGYGDLKAYLDTHFSDFTYLGIDQMIHFIEEAQKRYEGAKNTFFIEADFFSTGFPEVDYILASGALSYKAENMLYPFNLISKMFNAAQKGIAFNMLDAATTQPEAVLRAYHKEQILKQCRVLSSNLKLVTDYTEDDFTIFMYK